MSNVFFDKAISVGKSNTPCCSRGIGAGPLAAGGQKVLGGGVPDAVKILPGPQLSLAAILSS